MIPFNVPPYAGKEINYIKKTIKNRLIRGNGTFTIKCNSFFEKQFKIKKSILTTSGTHALEMAAILCNIKEGDEVIMPSYTFSSTANAFVLRGARIVFVDIRKDTMNIDEKLIERAITDKTKAIVPVHYAGVSCEMDEICAISKKYNLFIVEDAAQGVMSKYKDKALGSIGDFGCFSFHETKNYSCGEGGALLIHDEKYIEKAEILLEKGTNRSKFFKGQVDKYTWVDMGSSYLPAEINAAYLWAQLEIAEEINKDRLKSWKRYYEKLKLLSDKGVIELPYIPNHCIHNGHMFYVKVNDLKERTELINHMKQNEIMAIFHYIPLHSSPAGKKFSRFDGKDINTTKESERLVRFPLFYGIKPSDIDFICNHVIDFFKNKY